MAIDFNPCIGVLNRILKKLGTGVTIVPSGTQDVNITKVNGTAQTARDWSADFLKLQNVDITITALKDALRGAGTKDFTTLQTTLDAAKVDLDNLSAKM